mmetsp:Transcript_14545/g.43420  ORF Transcript_14545/g.43420 Transcript_14545/m.43420 type:complete len:219 (-) Transcript_14545:7-663(-)
MMASLSFRTACVLVCIHVLKMPKAGPTGSGAAPSAAILGRHSSSTTRAAPGSCDRSTSRSHTICPNSPASPHRLPEAILMSASWRMNMASLPCRARIPSSGLGSSVHEKRMSRQVPCITCASIMSTAPSPTRNGSSNSPCMVSSTCSGRTSSSARSPKATGVLLNSAATRSLRTSIGCCTSTLKVRRYSSPLNMIDTGMSTAMERGGSMASQQRRPEP